MHKALAVRPRAGFVRLSRSDDDGAGGSNRSGRCTVQYHRRFLIKYAKANPGKVRVGNSGAGSIWHLAASALEGNQKVTFNHIPFDGAAPAVTALMGKHIEAVTVNAGEVKAGVDAGKLKILAIMTQERDPAFPKVPTLIESGINLELVGWGRLWRSKGYAEAGRR